MGEVLLGSWKAYVGSVYSSTLEPLGPDAISTSAGEATYAEGANSESEIIPTEDDGDVLMESKRSNMRNAQTRRGWLFSSGYKTSEQDMEIQRQYLPMPKRVISPWCTNWEGRELNEMVLFNAFGYPSECFREGLGGMTEFPQSL